MAHPSAYRWFSGRDTSSILVYADDPYHPSPNTYTDQALQALGLSYTAHYDADFQGFESDLESGTWDLVIFADDNWFPPGSTLGKLTQYVHAGGTLIFQSWTVFANPSNPLYAELGFKWIQADTEPPHPEYWWDPSNPIFTTPQSAQQWTDLVGPPSEWLPSDRRCEPIAAKSKGEPDRRER